LAPCAQQAVAGLSRRTRRAVAWLLGGQCLRLADYVTVTAPTGEAVAAGCC